MTSEFAYDPQDAWNVYASQQDREAMHKLAQKYIDFLSACKTERETTAHIQKRLEEAGFQTDNTARMYRQLRGKTLFAARKGASAANRGLNLIAAHVDAPRLDFKQHPFVEKEHLAQAKTHYYGGIRKYQWLARPLALHGAIIREDGEKISIRVGEKPGEPVFCIADLLPHLAQNQSKKTLADAFDGEKLNIILGHEPFISDDEKDKNKEPIKTALFNFFHEKYGIKEEDFITAELEAVPAGPALFTGFDQSMIGGYGQDDRICAFCALEAFMDAGADKNISVMFWDKEETGSDGATGASSRFFQYCMEDLAKMWQQPSAGEFFMDTSALCADVTAALDPDYADVHEKNNAARFGFGPCFSKFTGSRGKYGTSEADAEFFAVCRQIMNANGIPWQAAELGKVDLGGGGTVAMFMAAYGMRVIDCGPALLSMHSPFELSSVADLYATYKAYRAFFENCGPEK